MFTDCPECSRQFRIRADQLAAAAGEVRCGFCGRQFNAIGRLRDAPLSTPAVVPAPLPDPEFEIAVPASAPAPVPPPVRARPARPAPVPPELLPEPEPAAVPRRGAWRIAALLLVLLAAAQVAWFQRDVVIGRFPELRPWAERLCGRLGCELVEFRDLSAIELVNRDVRLHPLYENSLLVNATIRNVATQAQPWPRVQLVLFNTEGRAIGRRDFAPREYLDPGVDTRSGMAAESSAHFVLEITGPTNGAVSFEFGFL